MHQKIPVKIGRGFYGKFFFRLKELEKEVKGLPKEGFIPYSYVYEKSCRNFSMKKDEIREIIFLLRDTGFLEVSQLGIKLNFKIKNA